LIPYGARQSSANFNNLCQGQSLTYNWSFGDNQNLHRMTPRIFYTTGPGAYTVSLGITERLWLQETVLPKTNYVNIAETTCILYTCEYHIFCPPLKNYTAKHSGKPNFSHLVFWGWQ